jgi:hypothetical protein
MRIAALLLAGSMVVALTAGSSVASAQARRTTIRTATGFQTLPPPPPIVGYPPQIYMNMLPPGVAGPGFGSNRLRGGPNFGFAEREQRYDVHRFDQSFRSPRDNDDSD